MLKVSNYLNHLPDEVLVNGEFCVTKIGDKQPYDPFKKMAISARDTFYPIDEILALDDIEKYDTLGIKVSNGISVIDLDNCRDIDTGEMSEVAIEVINFMKSYTELSPSGKGVRILFKAANTFDFTTYKTKDSITELEYYDAVDQSTRGARMARLSGYRISNYEFREVDTTWLLDKYMKRNYVLGEVSLIERPIRDEWVDLVYVLIATRSDLKNIFNREMFDNYESESDLIICNAIAEYTDNPNEIMEVFKRLRYYKTKGLRSSKRTHKSKWDGNYGWNTVNMANPRETVLVYEQRGSRPDIKTIIKTGVRFGLMKKYYFRQYTFDWDKELSDSEIINSLYELTDLKLARANLRVEMIRELETLNEKE